MMDDVRNLSDLRIAFFGGEPLAVPTLKTLWERKIIPSLVITNPDRPSGRKLELTPPPAKEWAQKHKIEVFQPEKLKDPKVLKKLRDGNFDLCIVVAYGKIIPKEILEIPRLGVINVHPSLLPKLRGPSPIRSALLQDERTTGVTVMLMDEEMDHGPIVAQEKIEIDEKLWPLRGRALDELLANAGANLLARTIPEWVGGNITPKEQDHSEATYTEKITKEMGEIELSDDPYKNLLKIRAFDGWPGAFFFVEKGGRKTRVKITDAELAPDGSLKINRVIPEGKKEIAYEKFRKY